MCRATFILLMKTNAMKSKRKIYLDMIRDAVVQSRNASTLPMHQKAFNKSSSFELELVHNLFDSLNDDCFSEHDIYFLNNQAKWYLENCTEKLSPLFAENKKRIEALISMVPPEKQSEIILSKADEDG